jgi:DNA-directed RNA polymerase subunit RPC12/RpoP
MSNSGGPSRSWTRCVCSVCSGHLEFDSDSDLAGETIQCPHCGMPTILFIPRIPLPAPARLVACSDCGTPFAEGARSCSECGRVIERPLQITPTDAANSSTILSPTAAGAWLVMAILLVIVVGGPIYWWRSQYPDAPKPESELQQQARLRSEAEGEMLKECTNVVVGLTRIIRASSVTAADDPYRWSGDVVAEFINHVGGIDRTNIFFKFGPDTGSDGLAHLRCSSEPEADHRARQRAEKR